jgi:excisionase family DNA binding protein
MDRKLISIKDAARMLGVSTLTLRNWDRNGKLTALRHPMNNYRVYKAEDINNLIENIGRIAIAKVGTYPNRPKPRKLNVLHMDD